MVSVIDIFTAFVSIIVLSKSIAKARSSARHLFYVLFFAVAVTPLILDYAIGFPNYFSWETGLRLSGFVLSSEDAATRILYDVYLLIFPLVLFNVRFKRLRMTELPIRDDENQKGRGALKRGVFVLLAFLAVFPILLVVLLPMPNELLIEWGWRDSGLISIDTNPYYYSVEKLTYVGVVSSIMLVLNRRNDGKYNIFSLFWLLFLYMNMCIESKRSIIFFAYIVAVCYLMCTSSRKSFKRIGFAALIAIVLFVSFSVFVKINYRGYVDMEAIYTSLRIDFFRDDTIKMAIFSVLNPSRISILQYPFESYLLQIGYLFPLGFIGVPKMEYNLLFTCALQGVPLSTGLNYMTTSMLDEVVSNFGIIGFVVAPIFSALLADLCDGRNPIVKTLYVSIYTLLLMYSLSYILWFVEAAVVAIVYINTRDTRLVWVCRKDTTGEN